jgi:16S rRNA (cytidine1402-2'-O)-methyltransferase
MAAMQADDEHAAERPGKQADSGQLVLAGAPLGNAADASPRLAEALVTADVIAAEDTRRLKRLATDLGVRLTARVVSYFEANEATRTPELIEELQAGRRVLLVTDAGMPSVSDPGYRLVAGAVAAGVAITCVPGPSAVTTALALSGLPVDRFCFEGFLPRRAAERRSRLEALAAEPRTLVFFEAPHRVVDSLAALAGAFGADRPAAVCRELTKTYEEIKRGPLSELAAWAEPGVKGEITLVVGGAVARGGFASSARSFSTADLVDMVDAAELAGMTRKEAVIAVGKATGAGRRAVFEAVVARKHQEGGER